MNYNPRNSPHSGQSERPINITLRTTEQVIGPAGEPYKETVTLCMCVLGFFGFAGIHRFYLGKYGTGFLYLVTLGFLGVGTIIDLINIRSMVRDANIRAGYLAPRRFRAAQGIPQVTPPARSSDLRMVLLQAAKENGGVLTVTQGVMSSKRSFEDVERALNAMVDKGYVDVDNAPSSGVVIYRFPDLARQD